MRNLAMHLWLTLDKHQDVAAMVEVDGAGATVQITFKELMRDTTACAMALLERGLEPGARIGLAARSPRAWLTLACGAWLAGACLVPLPAGRGRRDILRRCARSGAEWIVVTDRDELDEIRGQGDKLPPNIQWIVLDGAELPRADTITSYQELVEKGRHRRVRGGFEQLKKRAFGTALHQPSLIVFEPQPEDDPHGAFFTGEALGTMLTNLGADLLYQQGDRLACLLDFGWYQGLLMTLATLLEGKTVACAASPRALSELLSAASPTHILARPAFLEAQAASWQQKLEEAPEFLRQIAEGESTSQRFSFHRVLSAVGERAAQRALYEPIQQSLGTELRGVYVVGGTLPDDVHEVLERLHVAILGMWGLPEAGITHLERLGAQRRNSVGRPIQGTVCVLEGAKGEEPGQVLLKSDTLYSGYWDQEGPRSIQDGWLHTGVEGVVRSGFLSFDV
ncbi:MAG: AMP-binding protein [Myxococcota bacterium]